MQTASQSLPVHPDLAPNPGGPGGGGCSLWKTNFHFGGPGLLILTTPRPIPFWEKWAITLELVPWQLEQVRRPTTPRACEEPSYSPSEKRGAGV